VDLGIPGKRALVLASSRGRGLAAARVLAREGASVILSGRDQARLAGAVRSIGAEGGKADAIATDLTQPDSISTLNAAVERKFGGIDILINNVGGPPAKPISAVPIDEWRREFDAMVGSVLRVTGHFLPGMRARRWGRIIIIIASSGVVQPIANLGISNALRSSLVAWSKTLSSEVAADGVTVNVILPGRIHTERVDEMDAFAAQQQNKSRLFSLFYGELTRPTAFRGHRILSSTTRGAAPRVFHASH
jgi:3-oxoacyl-[acyl-carrier protein] reductase